MDQKSIAQSHSFVTIIWLFLEFLGCKNTYTLIRTLQKDSIMLHPSQQMRQTAPTIHFRSSWYSWSISMSSRSQLTGNIFFSTNECRSAGGETLGGVRDAGLPEGITSLRHSRWPCNIAIHICYCLKCLKDETHVFAWYYFKMNLSLRMPKSRCRIFCLHIIYFLILFSLQASRPTTSWLGSGVVMPLHVSTLRPGQVTAIMRVQANFSLGFSGQILLNGRNWIVKHFFAPWPWQTINQPAIFHLQWFSLTSMLKFSALRLWPRDGSTTVSGFNLNAPLAKRVDQALLQLVLLGHIWVIPQPRKMCFAAKL